MDKELDVALNTLVYKLKCEEIYIEIIDKCKEEIFSILKHSDEINMFVVTLYNHIIRFNEHKVEMLESKKIFETIIVSKGIKSKMVKSVIIYSYRYKNNGNRKNIRILFTIYNDIILFLSCFMEKDKKEYNKYIEKAVNRLNKYI